MSFLYPSFLYALFALAIPVIIHLFSFRRFRRIYFTNVKFLKEVTVESQSRSRIKHLLVLMMRLLALTFLILAFAQPYIPQEESRQAVSGSQTVSIFLDNSFSMDAVNDNGRLFEQAKQLAYEISNAYQPTDQFQILTNDFESRHQRLVNREELTELIDEIEISASSKKISEIISRQRDASLARDIPSKKTFFIISDFQKTMADLERIPADTAFYSKLILLQSVLRNNLYIDSCWFISPIRKVNEPDELHVHLVNKSENVYENVPVKFSINGQVRAIGTSFTVPANSGIDTVLNITSTSPGWQNCAMEITDYPITFDDKFFLSYDIARKINILLISQDQKQTQSNGKESIQSLFGAEPAFNMTVTSVRNIDYSSFSRNNLILLLEPDSISSGLSQELKKYTENGGSLLVIPSDEINVNSYRDFLRQMDMNYPENKDTSSTRISAINREHMIYRDVFEEEQNENINIDLPVVHKQYRISRLSQTKEEWLMKTQNGNNVLSRYPVGSGFAYLSGISLSEEFSNFTQHAIFVPTLFQIALNSRPTGKLYYTIGNDNYIEINNPAAAKPGTDNIYHIVSEDKTIDFIPETKAFDSRVRLYMHDQVLKAGNYYITRGADTISTAAFNYNRSESDLLAYSSDELKRVIQKQGLANFSLMDSDIRIIGKTIGEISEGIRLWKYCIILALFFLTAEIVLLRWWK